MEGFENAIEWWALEAATRFGVCNYLEIGVAAGRTLGAVCRIVRGSGRSWSAIGVDIEHGWSLSLPDVERSLEGIQWSQGGDGVPGPSSCLISLEGSQVAVPKLAGRHRIHLALIDGCHEFDCVGADFEAVSRVMEPGGMVLFHDAGEDQNGGCVQPHRGEPIRVWDWLKASGLLDRGVMLRGDGRLGNPISMFALRV